jgi:hypothetical protein
MNKNVNPKYDFNFTTNALGLILVDVLDHGQVAINPAMIISIKQEQMPAGPVMFTATLHEGIEYTMTSEQMAGLEQTIKSRAEDSKIIRRESMKEQMLAQYEISLEIQNGVQRAAGIVGIDGRGGRRH